MMVRFPIISLLFSPPNFLSCGIAPILLLWKIWQSDLMSVNSPIVLKLPIITLSPILTLSSITLYAPIVTLEPIFAFLEIILVG
tara:strand:+ start:1644 stop:1895 length:252 start_codon:yes stop_codon:yes gene_type:complete